MLLTEYDEAKTMQMFREESRENGRAEGRLEVVFGLVRDGVLDIMMLLSEPV